MKHSYKLLPLQFFLFAALIFINVTQIKATVLINPATGGGFESGNTFPLNGWTLVNHSINKWFVGSVPAGYSGTRCAYISNNGGGANAYTGLSQVSHFYQDITITSSEPNFTLTFNYQGIGSTNASMLVYLEPVGAGTPTAGSTVSAAYLIASNINGYYGYSSWTAITINQTCLTPGTYHLVFSFKSASGTVNQPPSAVDNISLVTSGCASSIGPGYVNVSSLPYVSTGRSTCGQSNDFTSANTLTCGSSAYLAGEDEIFEFKPTASGVITISIANLTNTSTSIMLYKGCPLTTYGCGSAGVCITYNQTAASSKSLCTSVQQDSTYYVLIDESGGCSGYDISITAPGGLSNDLPCGATALSLGSPISDDNSCAGGTGEPATPNCWNAGILNTVWYSFVAPSSGSVRINYLNGTLTEPQIDIFSGACGSLTSTGYCFIYSQINCGGASVSGLTSGNTYYIRLDGYGNLVGNYYLLVDDASGTITPTSADCAGAIEVCGTSYTIPGNAIGCGTVVDVSAYSVSDPGTNPNCCNSGCLLNGEFNSRWFRLNINSTGNLAWTLTCTAGTGYFDWIMYNITNSSCAAIDGNSLAPIRCNWNAAPWGMTGMQNPAPNGYTGNFEQPLAVNAGETYMLCITNWSYLTSPYSLDFSNSTCTFGGAISTWQGYNGTNWAGNGNWTGCSGSPACSVSAVINASANQPTISANASVNNLTINSGSTLAIASGVTLSICGNLINNGTLTMSPTATVVFVGTGTQNVTGSFTGTNKFGNFTVTKTTGSVVLNSNIDIAGNFTTSNATSILNANGRYIKLAKNFANSSGSTTFANVSTGTLEFNGSANQNFAAGGSLTLYNVVMNQSPASSVTLIGNNLNISNSLTLTSGRITTGSNETNVTNIATASVPTGNSNSYVDGKLRRSINTSGGSYDFPVGNFSVGAGYQRANINFTAATNVTNLLAQFQTYGSIPAALGVNDCAYQWNMPALNNGYWTIASTPTMTSGSYTVTLYNSAGSYSNAVGISYTVMKKDGGAWYLSGTCAASTVNQVVRTGLTSFSDFGTAQSAQAIPTPVELLYFTGEVTPDGNLLNWQTASELNNDFFTLERSADTKVYDELATIDGAGTSSEMKEYNYLDKFPLWGSNYYRLKQTDFNGISSYSQVITLKNNSGTIEIGAIVPNPTSGDFDIYLSSNYSGALTIQITDILGNVVQEQTSDAKAGDNILHASLLNQCAGIYFLKINAEETGFNFITKVIKY